MTIKYNANYIETMPFSDTCVQVNITTASQQTFTVPGLVTAQYQAYFEYTENSNVFVCLNGVPTVPTAGSVGTQQYNEFRPKKRYVKGGDVIHFITPDTSAYVGVSLRQLQG
jgi:predicted amidohydrolase